MNAVSLSGGYESGKVLDLRDRLDRRWTALKSQRTGDGWDTHWRDIADHMRPRRSRFMLSNANKGTKINQSIIDNTGVMASNILASAMMNGMSSPAQQWFKYEPDDLELLDYGPVKDWIGMMERVVSRIFSASNTYEALPLIYDELGLFGTAASIVEDDFDDVIRLNTFTVGEYCLAVNKRRTVDTLYREMRMTVRNVIAMFGLKNVSSTVRSAYDSSNYDQWVDIVHAVEPNDLAEEGKVDAKNMAFRSVYWEAGADSGDNKKRCLRHSGYKQNPIIAPRWSVIGNDVYGRSPGMDALGDVRQLQIQQKRKGEAIDKLVRPPTQGPAALADRFISQLPGAHTVVADMSQGGVKALYEIRPDINALVADMEDTRARIEDAFFVPSILAISRMEGVQPKNQMELAERKGEGLLVLGPVIERLQNELHSPLHKRALARVIEVSLPFWQQGEAGMLPPPPPELEGMPLQVTYISALAQVQKSQRIQSMQIVSNEALKLVELFPEVRHKFDALQYMDEMQDAAGAPSRIIRGDDAVEEMAAQEQQAKQAQQMTEAMPAMKDAATALKTFAETPVNGRSALDSFLEQAQGA